MPTCISKARFLISFRYDCVQYNGRYERNIDSVTIEGISILYAPNGVIVSRHKIRQWRSYVICSDIRIVRCEHPSLRAWAFYRQAQLRLKSKERKVVLIIFDTQTLSPISASCCWLGLYCTKHRSNSKLQKLFIPVACSSCKVSHASFFLNIINIPTF